MHRREMITATGTALAIGGIAATFGGPAVADVQAATEQPSPTPKDRTMTVRFALNTSTVRGQGLSVPEQVKLAAAAGYDGIEPWIRDIQQYVEKGGSLDDLRKLIADSGLTVDSAIGFAKWIVDDPAERAAGLEEARRDMEMVGKIGGTRIAAPPVGAQNAPGPALDVIAERYRSLLDLGKETGVVPQLELWGFSKTLSRLGELAYVATAAEHPLACVLPDFYHIYKGGSRFDGLGMIEASRMHVFHMNDYPATPPRETIADADRVFPGDGVCPLPETIALLLRGGFVGTFSLELFNPEYWKRDAAQVAKEGLEKSKAVVAKAQKLLA
jgi:2-keto-myo-inositol isomerase